jgi:hypothetical protein
MSSSLENSKQDIKPDQLHEARLIRGARVRDSVTGCPLELPLPQCVMGGAGETAMKLLAEYVEHTLSFERMAAQENNREVSAQFEKQAEAYRKLAAERAARYGLSDPSPPPSQPPRRCD